ncbi:MAG TPA: bifunctional transaldolase/phosoglucose isomerase [Candidatus Angelobacter sp.]|nr:bifunctional transaldolase/phosoglucose isomerase [Candidatus Angelobacter sp.]
MTTVSTLGPGMESTAAPQNPLLLLQKFGQSVWLDFIRRNLLTSGELKRLIEQDGLRGMTSNPSIFEKAITGSTDYTDILAQLHAQNLSAAEIFERLAVRDIQDAADVLRPVYQATNRRDGYVSLEVSPTLARNTQGTIAEARRLWKAVARENVMIKVPGTPEGVPAIRQLISEGINVNVTLLFAQEAHVRVAEAFIEGLEARLAAGNDVSKIAGVASFFVSRIDSLVDAKLSSRLKNSSSPQETGLLNSLLGKVAIANAKQAYRKYEELFSSARWKALAAHGAQTQRLLWASTSTKNPSYSDVLYVDQLIGPDTVNTIPPATFDAFRDHGHVERTLDADLLAADKTMDDLARAGLSMQEVTEKLLEEGIQLFADAFHTLLAAIDQKKTKPASVKPKIECQYCDFPAPLKQAVDGTLENWRANDNVRRLWRGDASLWTKDDEDKWLGWLHVAEDRSAHLQRLAEVAAHAMNSGVKHALLLGMGGSSLCPEVLKITFGKQLGHPELYVLDSTDPAQIKAVEAQIDLTRTVFIVASKSGTTLEPNIFKQYFFDRAQSTVNKEAAGRQFIAITDPGSKMEKVAEGDGFRNVFYGVPSIGGRYSALSNFGMVPAAIMGLDVRRFLERTEEMIHACAATVAAAENPGVVLGAILGTLANLGRNKVTLVASPGVRDLGAWLEQLLAESTGKQGKGLIPVAGEELGQPEVYGNDRTFIYLRLKNAVDATQDARIDALRKAGQPVVRIDIADIYDLGQEFFRWEIATAVAGSVIGINAFNQPDVEASKVATRQLTEEYEKSGKLPAETPFFEENGCKLFTDEANAARLRSLAGKQFSLDGILRAHLGQLGAGDYFALLAYLQMNDEHERGLQAIRHAVRDSKRVATCVGFGPRFLHSTGQAYKGGPNTGVFLQITCDDAVDLPVPGQKYTFGVVKAAQARGDFQVLADRKRRALRVHLGKDVSKGLERVGVAVREALSEIPNRR